MAPRQNKDVFYFSSTVGYLTPKVPRPVTWGFVSYYVRILESQNATPPLISRLTTESANHYTGGGCGVVVFCCSDVLCSKVLSLKFKRWRLIQKTYIAYLIFSSNCRYMPFNRGMMSTIVLQQATEINITWNVYGIFQCVYGTNQF